MIELTLRIKSSDFSNFAGYYHTDSSYTENNKELNEYIRLYKHTDEFKYFQVECDKDLRMHTIAYIINQVNEKYFIKTDFNGNKTNTYWLCFIRRSNMFSSNQRLEISGDLTNPNELLNALKFALTASDELRAFEKGSLKCVYQITKDGRYCIGWGFEKVEDGWTDFPFDFDLNIISQIIKKHLEKQEIKYNGYYDGSYYKGFLMKVIELSMAEEDNGIVQPFYGIVEFSPYTCFYSK